MFGSPETWVAIAFLLFVALMVYLKVPAMVAKLLDDRAAGIERELAEARKLREEAQALVEEYKRKRIEAERTAADIVALAHREAKGFAEEQGRKLAETVERRGRQAEQKIAQAEAQAIKEVRAAATDIAIAAAGTLSAAAAKGTRGAKLIEDSIAAVKTRLN